MAFGKRVRIANAIAELRRPPSIILTDHQLQRTQSITYAHSPSGSTQHSLNSPMFTSMGSTFNGPPSSTLVGPGSLESPRAETFTSPLITKRVSSHSSAGASVNGGGSVGGGDIAAGIEKAGFIGVAGLGLRALPETQLASCPSDTALAAPEEKSDGITEEDRGALSEVSVVGCASHVDTL